MSIRDEARAEAASYARHAIGGMQPVETVGDKVRNAFISGYLAGAQRAESVSEPPRDLHSDGLAAILHDADCGCGDTPEHAEPYYSQADAIIAAGWTAPATTKPDFAVGEEA